MSISEFCASIALGMRIGDVDIDDAAAIAGGSIGRMTRHVELQPSHAHLAGGLVASTDLSMSTLEFPHNDSGDIAFWSFKLPPFFDVSEPIEIFITVLVPGDGTLPTDSTEDYTFTVGVARTPDAGSASPSFVTADVTGTFKTQGLVNSINAAFAISAITFVADDSVVVEVFRDSADTQDIAEVLAVPYVRFQYVSKNG